MGLSFDAPGAEHSPDHGCHASGAIDNGFLGYSIIGYSGDPLSTLACREKCSRLRTIFPLRDSRLYAESHLLGERSTYLPLQGAQLLREHGEPPQEWDES